MRRGVLSRIESLERSVVAPSPERQEGTRPVVEMIREWLAAWDVTQEPRESLAETFARALGTTSRELQNRLRAENLGQQAVSG